MSQASEEPILLREERDGIVRLTLNRPRARNALSLAMMEALLGALETIRADPAARVVILAGAGPGFCAGHDLKELRARPERPFYERTFATCARLMQTILALPQPVIARVHGVATAAGCQLVATCDLAVAAETARFATPGVNIGLFCSTPMVALARNVGRKAAMEMLLLGELVDAPTAKSLGLVNRVVPKAEVEAYVANYAATICENAPLTVSAAKQILNETQKDAAARDMAKVDRLVAACFASEDYKEGRRAFMEKRKPNFQGR
jgi:enoyl-CoA hydratase/carnithine racemase